MRALFALAFLSIAAAAHADPSGYCFDASSARENVVEEKHDEWIKATPEQWQFLRGIYAMNPATPPGLPFGDSAIIVKIPGEQGGAILFIDDDRACTPMQVPQELLDMLERVGGEDIPHANGPA
jgi:hypothetical protein